MNARLKAPILVTCLFQSYPAFGRLLLYLDQVFLGCLGCIQAVPDSVCNLNGPYGQLNSKTSIWNQVSKYGGSEPMVWQSEGPIDGRSTRYSVWSIPGQS